MAIEITVIGEKNLEAFEGILPHSLTKKLVSKQEDLFAFGTISDGMASGTIVCLCEGSCVHILSLYAACDFRGQGLEAALLNALIEKAGGCGHISHIEAHLSKDNAYNLREIYERAGFYLTQAEDKYFEISLARLRESALFKKNDSSRGFGVSFGDMSTYELNRIKQRLISNHADFIEMPLSRPGISKELSAAVFDNDQMKGVIIFDDPDENGVNLIFMYAAPDFVAALLPLLRNAFVKISKMYGGDAIIGIPVVSQSAESLVRKIAGQAILTETTGFLAEYDLERDNEGGIVL